MGPRRGHGGESSGRAIMDRPPIQQGSYRSLVKAVQASVGSYRAPPAANIGDFHKLSGCEVGVPPQQSRACLLYGHVDAISNVDSSWYFGVDCGGGGLGSRAAVV
jgi:hypothetical protein